METISVLHKQRSLVTLVRISNNPFHFCGGFPKDRAPSESPKNAICVLLGSLRFGGFVNGFSERQASSAMAASAASLQSNRTLSVTLWV